MKQKISVVSLIIIELKEYFTYYHSITIFLNGFQNYYVNIVLI